MQPAGEIEALKQRIAELEGELRQARNESAETDQKKTMFLANMSHEIRTPMNSILGIYNLLNQTNLTDEQREFLDIIHIASQNLLTIINDILDLSKIESGQLKLENKPFRLHEEVQQVIKLLSLKARGRGLDLFSMIDVNVPSCVIGDPVRLKQILINLANNAIKYTSDGEVRIAVEVMHVTTENQSEMADFIPEGIDQQNIPPKSCILKFLVQDTGIGISTEDQKRLFQEFSQVDNPLTKEFEGTGLGLSISSHLTKIMHGRMGVTSEPGEGSVFWFTLWFPVCDTEEFHPKKPGNLPSSLKGRKLHILLVEDNMLNQKFAVTTLKREGHEVDIAENGKIAVEKFLQNTFDVILMDIAMPVMDGLEASREVRRIESEKRKIMTQEEASGWQPVKIIGITAHVMMTDKEQCLNSGMNEYLAKPYRPNDLLVMIEACLSRKS